MKQWVVLSGKGGTGKTSVAASLAHLASADHRLVLADADVDAANLELLLSPRRVETHDFLGTQLAEIAPETCTGCGVCADVCRFEAVLTGDDGYAIDPVACEGCAACFHQCPAAAIRMVDRLSGQWFQSSTPFGPLFHARLFAGQENSGKLVSVVKLSARALGDSIQADLLLVDGPPGIGCPVIASVTGADLALLVAEPTVSGVHDLQRILATTQHFRVPAAVCINKADINPLQAEAIEDFCRSQQVPVLGSIPFDQSVVEAIVSRRAVTVASSGPAAEAIRALWGRLAPLVQAGPLETSEAMAREQRQ